MTFTGAIKSCFRKYVTFSGRAPRSEFWKFILFLLLVSVILTILNTLIFGPSIEGQFVVSVDSEGNQTQSIKRTAVYDSGWLGTFFMLATLLPTLAVGVRRLHDIGRSGWFVCLPIVGSAVAFAILWATSTTVQIDTSNLPEGAIVPSEMPVPQSAGLFFLCWLIAVASCIATIVMLARKPQPDTNKYGPNPLEVSQ